MTVTKVPRLLRITLWTNSVQKKLESTRGNGGQGAWGQGISCNEKLEKGRGRKGGRMGEDMQGREERRSLKCSNDLLIDEGPKLWPQITTEPENGFCVLPPCAGTTETHTHMFPMNAAITPSTQVNVFFTPHEKEKSVPQRRGTCWESADRELNRHHLSCYGSVCVCKSLATDSQCSTQPNISPYLYTKQGFFYVNMSHRAASV